MEFFSEIYNCYYQLLRHLLTGGDAMTIQDIREQISREGFGESLLSIIPKIESGEWNLFERDGDLYYSKISSDFALPLSHLQKSYLKALLSDPRTGLFLDPDQAASLHTLLGDTIPLWKPGQFFYFDRFTQGDDYSDEKYRHNFRTLLHAMKTKHLVDIDYNSPRGNRVHHHYLPCRLEYSIKNDKFRLFAVGKNRPDRQRAEILNVGRMQDVTELDEALGHPVDINALIRKSYYKEPLRLRIINRRNALERAMLHFANYEKNTTKIDEDTYECLIYYNQKMETELLIEVMSFGPMITVLGNERFLSQLKSRLQKQRCL